MNQRAQFARGDAFAEEPLFEPAKRNKRLSAHARASCRWPPWRAGSRCARSSSPRSRVRRARSGPRCPPSARACAGKRTTRIRWRGAPRRW